MKDKKCVEQMRHNYIYYTCGKPAKMEHGGHAYCGRHDPVKRKAKQDERMRKYCEEQARRDAARLADKKHAELLDRCHEAIKQIAAGHNDARALAVEVLKQ